MRRIAHGDYRARVRVKGRDEVAELATAFNQMAEDVEKHQRAAVGQERIRRELELGRQIQHDMLPHEPLRLGLTEIKGVSVPAREVGGDFFNYFQTPSGQIALLVGDVSGKGVGAALLMANIQASLRTRLALGQDLSALARELDADIEAGSPGPVYATLFVGILDPVDARAAARERRAQPAVRAPHERQPHAHGVDRPARSGSSPATAIRSSRRSSPRATCSSSTPTAASRPRTKPARCSAPSASRRCSARSRPATDVLTRVEAAVTEFRGAREPFDDATMMTVAVG